MFADTLTTVSSFSKPLIISTRMLDGTLNSGTGTYVLLNSDGWALTAGHNLQAWAKADQDKPLVLEYDDEMNRISGLSDPKKRRSAKKALHRRIDPSSTIRNCSYWWGDDGITCHQATGSEAEVDLAAVELGNVPQGFAGPYPSFRTSFQAGRSLVRYGFPFPFLDVSFDEATGLFGFNTGSHALPFPIEGMATRLLKGSTAKGGAPFAVLETSSPGLRGQSGGPVVDVDAAVWGIQVRTSHLHLGFRIEGDFETDGKKKRVDEEAFLHVGHATHATTVQSFLDSLGISANFIS